MTRSSIVGLPVNSLAVNVDVYPDTESAADAATTIARRQST
jgi:hypothetical protein